MNIIDGSDWTSWESKMESKARQLIELAQRIESERQEIYAMIMELEKEGRPFHSERLSEAISHYENERKEHEHSCFDSIKAISDIVIQEIERFRTWEEITL